MARVKLPRFQQKKLLLQGLTYIQDQESSIVNFFEEFFARHFQLFLSLKLPRRFFREILGTNVK